MQEILAYCHGDEEKGGIIISGEFIPLKNIAKDKVNNFKFNLESHNFEQIEAIVHSHIGDHPYLSTLDRLAQVQTQKPWWIVANGNIYKYECVALLRGREFDYGKHDCAALIEDAYIICGIGFARYQRRTLEIDEGNNSILARISKLGFYQVATPQVGDVIITSTGGNPNHVALMIDDETVLHHVLGQYSRSAMYGAAFRKITHSIWRHENWVPRMIEAINYDLKASDYEENNI